jgi:superfamily II DNA helicase RecQ
MFGKVNIMVATTAFGMGIDKDNISYVIHFQMPLNLESYFQAAGRAGRDEKKVKEAECILFCKKSTKSSDYDTCMKIIKGKDGDNFREIDDEFEKIDDNIKFKEHKINLLNEMQNYVNTSECLYKFILNYFGEKNFEKCGKCNICKIDDIKKEKIEKENEKRIAERKEKDALIAEEQRLEAIKKNIDQSYERQRIEIKNNPDNFEAEICIDCGEYFAITHREVLRCNENRWGLPIRCRPCREKKKYGDLSRNR